MAYSDNRWNLVTAGRVYPKPKTLVHVVTAEARRAAEALARDNRERRERERAEAEALGDALLALGEALPRTARRRSKHEPLAKPAAYKAINSANVSGPSAVRS